jgi:hypothetical protein
MIPKPRAVTKYSSDTKSMLDSMMSQSGLPLAEQRRLRAAVNAGPSAQIAPRRGAQPAARRGPQPKGPYEDLLKGVAINPNLARQIPGAKLRTKEEIIMRNGGSLERPQYGGGRPNLNRGLTKEELQQKLEFGYVLGEQPTTSGGGTRHLQPAAAASAPPRRQESEEEALRSAIVEEIDERREFLDNMRALGKGKEHEARILGEISSRLADLKTLEKLG